MIEDRWISYLTAPLIRLKFDDNVSGYFRQRLNCKTPTKGLRLRNRHVIAIASALGYGERFLSWVISYSVIFWKSNGTTLGMYHDTFSKLTFSTAAATTAAAASASGAGL